MNDRRWIAFYERYRAAGCPQALSEYEDVEKDFLKASRHEHFAVHDFSLACSIPRADQVRTQDIWGLFLDTVVLLVRRDMPRAVCVARMATMLDDIRERLGGEEVI